PSQGTRPTDHHTLSLHDALPISTNIWVPAAVIGAIAAATVLIIVGLAVLLKPSAKEQNDPLAMVLGPRGQATPTAGVPGSSPNRSEEHTSELQSPCNLVCRLLLE